MYSFGFQQAYRRGIQPEDQMFIDNVRTPLRSSVMIRRCSFPPASTVFPGRKVGHSVHDRYVMPKWVHAVLTGRYVIYFQKGRITDAGRLRSANQTRAGHFVFASFASAFLLKVGSTEPCPWRVETDSCPPMATDGNSVDAARVQGLRNSRPGARDF